MFSFLMYEWNYAIAFPVRRLTFVDEEFDDGGEEEMEIDGVVF